MKSRFVVCLLACVAFFSCEQAEDVKDPFTGTTWINSWDSSLLSCKLELKENGTCTFTYYSDAYFQKQQSYKIGNYYIKGDYIEFGESFIVKRVPPLNGDTHLLKFKKGVIQKDGRMFIYHDFDLNGRPYQKDQILQLYRD